MTDLGLDYHEMDCLGNSCLYFTLSHNYEKKYKHNHLIGFMIIFSLMLSPMAYSIIKTTQNEAEVVSEK